MKKEISFPRDFGYLKKYYCPNASPFKIFHKFYHFGLSFEEITRRIEKLKPSIIGISSNFTPYFGEVLRIACLAKRVSPDTIVILGGHHPTAMPEFCLRQESIDFIIRGEGELSFLEFCESVKAGDYSRLKRIRGLGFRDNGKIHISPFLSKAGDLDMLPWPARQLLDLDAYVFRGRRSAMIISSRGCRLKCGFCEYSRLNIEFRFRNPVRVIEEMKYCFYDLGITHFDFEDDNINFNPGLSHLLELIYDNFAGKISVSFMNGVSSFGLSRKLIKLFKKSGLTHIDLSLVSKSRKLRCSVKRRESLSSFKAVLKDFKKEGVHSTTHFIAGLPAQSYKEVLSTLKYLSSQPTNLGVSIFYPVPNTELFLRLSKDFKDVNNSSLWRLSSCFYDQYISRYQLLSILYFSRVINFIKSILKVYGLKYINFPLFLENLRNRFKIKTEDIESTVLRKCKALSRDELAVLLLLKLNRFKKIFKVERLRGKPSIYIFSEDFLDNGSINNILNILEKSRIDFPA